MAKSSGRSWHLERASVHRKGAARARSNKYSRSDQTERPPVGSRGRVWVGAYDRADGTHVEGHFRKLT